jgi:ribonucleotide reductase beta subunit family protein with ferritin-like domain
MAVSEMAPYSHSAQRWKVIDWLKDTIMKYVEYIGNYLVHYVGQ